MKTEPEEQYKPAEKLELRELKKEFPKVFKKVNCPSCSEQVPADNLNLQNSVAKCGTCNVIFSIEEDMGSLASKKKIKQEVLRPEGIDLFFYKDELDITIQQHIHGVDAFGISLLPIAAVFSILVYFKKGLPIFFPALFIIGSLYYIYKWLNYSKNKTYVEINDRVFSIKHRPNNFKKDKTYLAEDIDQVYLKKSMENGVDYHLYLLVNAVEGQKHQRILTVNTLSKAKYLEQEIERYLNIEDREVPEATA